MSNFEVLKCADCGGTTIRRGPTQQYCIPCSTERDRIRKSAWARENPQQRDPEVAKARLAALQEDAKGRTPEGSIAWAAGAMDTDLAWLIRVTVPFSYSFSKNAVWSMAPGGHVHLRDKARAVRDELIQALTSAIVNHGADDRASNPFDLPGPIVQNRLWLDILVEKPNHKGDAINVIDSVCDGVKIATRLDDRWYSIRRLDWLVTKREQPRLFVGIGQEAVPDAQVCSYCGQILGLEHFGLRTGARGGVGRVCLECSRLSDGRRRKATKATAA